MVGIKRTLAAAAVKDFARDTLETGAKDFDLSGAAFQNAIDGVVSVCLEVSETLHMSLDIFLLDLGAGLLGLVLDCRSLAGSASGGSRRGRFFIFFAEGSRARKSRFALAVEATIGVDAVGVSMAVVGVGLAFVGVGARASVSHEVGESKRARSALALEGAGNVGALSMLVTPVVTGGTLIDIGTSVSVNHAISFESFGALALETTHGVDTLGGLRAGSFLGITFVNILACESVSFEVLESVEASSALAFERADSVGAFGVGVASVSAHHTFIHIYTLLSVTSETSVAFAAESTRVVDASGVIVAVVSHKYAFVDVLA